MNRPTWTRRLLSALCGSALLLLTACNAEAKKENESLKQQVQTLEMEGSRLKKDLEQKDKQIQALREQIKQNEVAMQVTRMGVSDPSTHLLARMKTNMGEVLMELDWRQAPNTVANFVGLAEGTKAFADPSTGQQVTRPFYDGLTFHRVIDGFMIQGGDPKGDGTGGPGYTFDDEFTPEMRFTSTGLLAMANAGPNTNGSQFFITTGTPEWLNGKHTIFGRVIQGYDVVEKISRVARDGRDRPNSPVIIEKMSIERTQKLP